MTTVDAGASPSFQLDVADQPAERADAARNRRALLAAAHAIMLTDGVDGLTMDRVAAEAAVGVGTVYRRFGQRSGLAHALLDDRERQFQEAFLYGPPPLGPGEQAAIRIRAFLHAYVDRHETEADLHAVADAQSPTARYRSGSYQIARVHLVALLTEAGADGDKDYLADVLLGTVDAGLFIHQRRERGFSLDRIKAGIDHLLAPVVG